jgi:hypothetical protein
LLYWRNSLEGVIDSLEFRRQSFVIKVWLDESETVFGETAWRGRITHVPSGESRYVTDLGEITSFIATHLQQMGARVKIQREQRSWLRWLNLGCRRTSSTKGDGE